MSYDHSLTLDAQLKDGTTLEAVIVAMRPILDYFGYEGREAFAGKGLYNDHHFTFDSESGELSIHTGGQVSDYLALVEQCAENLGPLADVPGTFVLKNYDTAELEDAITEIDFGPSDDAIRDYQFECAAGDAMRKLAGFLPAAAVAMLTSMAKAAYQSAKAGGQAVDVSRMPVPGLTPINELVEQSTGGKVEMLVGVKVPVTIRVPIDEAVLERLSFDPTLKPVIAENLIDQAIDQLGQMELPEVLNLIDTYQCEGIVDPATGVELLGRKEEVLIGVVEYEDHSIKVEFIVPDGASRAEKDSAFCGALAQRAAINYESLGYRPAAS